MKYVYVYLNPMKSGSFQYEDLYFEYQPFYVGMGSGNRYKVHKFNSKLNGKSHKINTIKKILKNGLEPIIIKLYENLSNDKAKLLEIETINKIGRKDLNKGTLSNRTNGGDSTGYKHNKKDLKKSMTAILCYDLNMQFIKEYDSIQKASDKLNITHSNISQCCRYLIKVCKGKFIFRYKDIDKNKHYQKDIKYKIIRVDYKNNVKLYRNVIEASKDTGVSQNSIVKVCKGRYLTGGNYLWRYKSYSKEFYKKIENNYRFDINREIIDSNNNKYSNSLEASIITGLKLYTICKNLSNDYTLTDYKFTYIN